MSWAAAVPLMPEDGGDKSYRNGDYVDNEDGDNDVTARLMDQQQQQRDCSSSYPLKVMSNHHDATSYRRTTTTAAAPSRSGGSSSSSSNGARVKRGQSRTNGTSEEDEAARARLTSGVTSEVTSTSGSANPPTAATSGSANIPLEGPSDLSAEVVNCAECNRHPRPLRARSRLVLHQQHQRQQQRQQQQQQQQQQQHCDSASTAEAGSAAESGSNARLRGANPLIRFLLRFTRKQEEEKKKDFTLDMLQPSRYKPNDLEQMAVDTKFTKREVRHLYRAFKQECPTGIVDEETFKEVYDKIFPLGDASHYAHLVFLSIDRERTGGITFGDFMEFLSVICKGSQEEKLLWTFEFYDVDRDGVISREEMKKVTESIHELMGMGCPSPPNPSSAAQQQQQNKTSNVPSSVLKFAHAKVDEVFDSMDANRDGLVSLEEFMTYCSTREDVRRSLMVLP